MKRTAQVACLATAFLALLGGGGNVLASTRIALLDDARLPVFGAPSSPSYLAKLFARRGHKVTRLSATDLWKEKRLSTANFDLLVLPQGPAFPARAKVALFSFLKQGGDLIAMGGYAFDQLCYQDVSGKWRTKTDLYGDFQLEPTAVPIDLCDLSKAPSDWTAGGGPGDPPVVSRDAGHDGGFSLKVYVDDNVTWHGATHEIGVEVPRGYDRFVFWARGDARTPQMSVELQEKDSSRWIAVVDLLPEWRQYVLSSKDFVHWTDGTQRSDQVHIDNLKRISFGMAYTHTRRLTDGPHGFWIDGVQAAKQSISAPGDDRINTRVYKRDMKEYIGAFDPSWPLKWVTSARAAQDQVIVRPDLKLRGQYSGYAAICMVDVETARWIPLINGYDRYGRLRGSVASMVYHHAGDRKGSIWAFFGVDNADLFSPKSPEMGEALLRVVGAMEHGLVVARTNPGYACYRVGERATAATQAANLGRKSRDVVAVLQILNEGGKQMERREQAFRLAPGDTRSFSMSWRVPAGAPDLCRIRATLLLDGKPVSTEESGFVVWNDRVLQTGPKLTFRDGRFMLDGKPRLLFGTNEYSKFWLGNVQDNPLGWDKRLRIMADDGIRIVRTHSASLISWPTREGGPDEAQFRRVDAWVQLCRKHGIYPYLDIMDWTEGMRDPWMKGSDYHFDPEGFRGQREYTRYFALRYRNVQGVLYDQDNESVDDRGSTPVRVRLWNDYLAEKYGTTERLSLAWGRHLAGEKLGEVAYSPGEDAWDNLRFFDWNYFHRTRLRDGWIRNFADAVREADPDAFPSQSGLNIGAQDQLISSGPLVTADNHYYHSLNILVDLLKGADLRPLGIGSALGEFGVITCPDNWDSHYYYPVDEQIRYFLWIGHYLAGTGASYGINWDFQDGMSGGFQWGIHHAGDYVEKEVLVPHRQQMRFFERIPMAPNVPDVVVCAPDNHRLGGQGSGGQEAAGRAMKLLVNSQVDCALIHEFRLTELPASTKALVFPVPYFISDETLGFLKSFVEKGGALYLSGDICFTPDRRYVGDRRLLELAGVRQTTPFDPGHPMAPRAFESAGARIVEPGIAVNRIGKGMVFYVADPPETKAYSKASIDMGLRIFRLFLEQAAIRPNPVVPDAPGARIHCFRQPLEGGGSVYIIVNADSTSDHTVTLDTGAGKLRLPIKSYRSAVAALDAQGEVWALEAQGSVTLNGKPLVDADAHFMMVSLDRKAIRQTQELMVLPVASKGSVGVHNLTLPRDAIVLVGQPERGGWRDMERVRPTRSANALELEWDDVRASAVLVLTSEQSASDAVHRVTHPLESD